MEPQDLSFNLLSLSALLDFPVESAGQEEEDQARDQNPGEPARRDQHYPTGGHSQRPSGRLSQGMSVLLGCYAMDKKH